MKFDQVCDHIVKMYLAGLRQTIYLSGPPGIAKSACALEASRIIAEKLELPFHNFRGGRLIPDVVSSHFGFQPTPMTVIDPLDFGGLAAVLDHGDGRGPVAERLPLQDIIPTEGQGTILFDDLPTAPPLTQAAAFRTIWERDRIGDNWLIVATGNRAEDRAAVQRIPTPLISKMCWINFEPDVVGWGNHMAGIDGSTLVRAYMAHNPVAFVNFDPTQPPGPFATARTWEALSEVCKAYAPKLPPFEVVKGWVGEAAAIEFMQFATMANDLVNPDTILLDPMAAPVPQHPGAAYVITTALASRASAGNFDRIVTYLGRLEPEMAIYCVKSALMVQAGRIKQMSPQDAAKFRKIDSTAAFRDFGAKNQDLLS
jgi:hypothetical protein